jgi:putative lipoprotein
MHERPVPQPSRRGDGSSACLGLLAFLVLSLLTMSTAMAELATIQGTATYRERMALPDGAVLEVELLDISRADASAARLASIRIKPQGQVPIAFTLHYDPALIEERLTYAVTAKILHQDRLLFRSDTIHPVLTRGAGNTVEVRMVRIPAERSEAVLPTLVGPTWVAEDIDRRGVIDNLQSFVTFTAEGQAHGFGGCNDFSGGYDMDGDRLEIGGEGARIASTLKACTPAVMDQEARFLDALGRVRFWRLNMGLLFLLDAEGEPILRLWRREP